MGEQRLQPDAATSIRDWLIDEAGFLEHFGLVVEGLSMRLVAAGVPLVRATAHVRVVHSERVGITRVWQRGKETQERYFGFGPEVDAMYQRSPIRIAQEERRRVDVRPEDPADADFGIMSDLVEAGVTHYLMFPLYFTGGQVNAASFATDRVGGFRDADIALIEGLLPALARVMEIKGLQRSRSELLRIYVGRLPAERILNGQIRRGDVVAMEAAILLCDLRRSTELAVELDEAAYVEMINGYFDCVVPAVTAAGGEVLKFIGDGVLAIFERPETGVGCPHCSAAFGATQAIFNALDALNRRRGLPGGPLAIGIALHEGRVAFGNIGSVERQDFTVIGQDVNLAARLCDLSGPLSLPLVVSDRFASRMPDTFDEIGEFELKGFPEPQRVYARTPGR